MPWNAPRWQEIGFVCHTLEDGSPFLEGKLPAPLILDEAAFEVLWGIHPSIPPTIRMVGRQVQLPRWQQAYGADYYFSGQISSALPVPEPLAPLLEWCRQMIDTRFNGLLLNWYEGPGHYIGAHKDSTVRMVKGAPIVTISFGESRTFRLSRGKGEAHQVRDFEAIHGGVFVLPQETNKVWKHAVPKSARYSGRRISVTVRAFIEP